jgi:hypothetical protein
MSVAKPPPPLPPYVVMACTETTSVYDGKKFDHSTCPLVRLRLKCDGTRAETRFRLSAKRTESI